VSDGEYCPIPGGVGLPGPIGSLRGGAGTAASSVARRPQLFSVSGSSGRTDGGDDLRRRAEVSVRGAPHLTLPAAGRSGWACAGAAARDAYVKVSRAKAAPSL
jgi:hypothetical protein